MPNISTISSGVYPFSTVLTIPPLNLSTNHFSQLHVIICSFDTHCITQPCKVNIYLHICFVFITHIVCTWYNKGSQLHTTLWLKKGDTYTEVKITLKIESQLKWTEKHWMSPSATWECMNKVGRIQIFPYKNFSFFSIIKVLFSEWKLSTNDLIKHLFIGKGIHTASGLDTVICRASPSENFVEEILDYEEITPELLQLEFFCTDQGWFDILEMEEGMLLCKKRKM